MGANKIPSSQRAQMLKRYMERDLSNDMRDTFSQHIANSAPPEDHATREAEAKKINAIIDSSRTEAEMLEKLKQL